MINITINGEIKEFKDNITVSGLLSEIGVDSRKIAVERNLQLVRRTEHHTTFLNNNDNIEIINFVGGG